MDRLPLLLVEAIARGLGELDYAALLEVVSPSNRIHGDCNEGRLCGEMLSACSDELSAEGEERYQRLEAVSLAAEDFLVR